MSQTYNLQWLNNLRFVATLSMIVLHIVAPILYKYDKSYNITWQIANIIDSCVRCCVPLFVMLTGALMLGKQYVLSNYLKKRASKIILPFIFWSTIYVLWDLFFKADLTMINFIKKLMPELLNGASYHLWYVYMIIGLYLFIPILSKAISLCSIKELEYFLIIWVISILLFNQPVIRNYSTAINISNFSGYVGYLVLGHYLSVKQFSEIKLLKLFSILLLAIGTCFTAVATYNITALKGEFDSSYYDYLTVNVLLASIGIFLLIKNSTINYFNLTINFICKYSFGIYLVHVLVLSLLRVFGITCFFINPAIGLVLTFVSCVGISTLIIYITHKIPFGKYISGV